MPYFRRVKHGMSAALAAAALDSAALGDMNSLPAIRKTVRALTWLIRSNLILQVTVTAIALTWGSIYTSALRRADSMGHEIFKLKAINDLWFGTRSGIALSLAAEWTKTIVIMIVVATARQYAPALIIAVATALKQ